MTYHLARAAFWKQNQNINHFTTTAEIQNENPVNGEIGLLWIMLLTNSDNITFLVQWFCFLIILIALYKLLRLLNFNKAVSLVSVFIFSTLDIVLLEASSTQNDLVAACFIAITLYLFLKVVKLPQPDFRYLVLSGISFGIAMGIKGNSYLIIPGFVIFLIVFGKNNKIKFIKLAYLLLFSISGAFLFSGYAIIQNYISYGNIFSANEYTDTVRITNPGFKTFISNFSKQISLFYQLNGTKFDYIGKFIRNPIVNLHKIINLELSSPITTWPDTIFYFSGIKLNFDESYFGPFYFFIILPSIFYNLLIFLVCRLWKKGSELIKRFKESLLILIIPASYFIIYTLIFKWQPYTGRHMVTFAVLTMISFALLVDFIFQINKKYFFQILSGLFIIIVIFLSFFTLFKQDYINLSKFDFKTKYEDRRGGFAKDELKLLNENLVSPYDIGLVLHTGDWVYMLFGKDYSNRLNYISQTEWNKNQINEILVKEGLDGVLVNKKSEVFLTQKYSSVFSKLTGNLILQIDKNNYKEYLRPLNDCELSANQEGILFRSFSDDPYFEMGFPESVKNSGKIIIKVSFKSPVEANAQFFYKQYDKEYNEQNSERFKVIKGDNNIYVYLNNVEDIEKIRIDPIDMQTDLVINKIEIFKLNNIRFKESGKFLLFY
ncbi:MAG: ArnT family glycosyltransferase [Candidatus Humimicrobiaceae bacterium]